MTDLLYLSDCYLKEFDAVITAANGKEIELDRTAFYPNSGGQPEDTGLISAGSDDYIVSSVVKDKGRIIHVVDKEGLKVGEKVHAQIDWVRRYVYMRYHTSAHVLTGVIHKETGAIITGNQIREDGARIDFNLESFNKDLVKDFEKKANEALTLNYPVSISFISREEAMKIPNITKLAMGLPESIKQVRLVSIKGFGQEACGGTHLANTKEAGQIEIYALENKGKSNRRIYFRLKGEEND